MNQIHEISRRLDDALQQLIENINEKDSVRRFAYLALLCSEKEELHMLPNGFQVDDEIWGDLVGLANIFLVSRLKDDLKHFKDYYNGLF